MFIYWPFGARSPIPGKRTTSVTYEPISKPNTNKFTNDAFNTNLRVKGGTIERLLSIVKPGSSTEFLYLALRYPFSQQTGSRHT